MDRITHIVLRVINGKKQRIITHESREWVWEIERLKDREREKELRCKLLFTRVVSNSSADTGHTS